MATQQQVLFAETIAGMKKAFKRRAYESDSDSEVDNKGNRGQKLKKRARFARKGQLVSTADPSSYRETVEYGGVQRAILHRNPPLVDEEGFEIDSDDDQERVDEAIAAAAELDPYADIRIEHILAPLTATTDLPTHPTLSQPFTSTTLSTLVDKSCAMTRKENYSLAQIRHLWTTLCGDYTWAPCEAMLGPDDIELYTEDHVARHLLQLSKTSADYVTGSTAQVNGEASASHGQAGSSAAVTEHADASMTGDGTLAGPEEQTEEAGRTGAQPAAVDGNTGDVPMTNGESASHDTSNTQPPNESERSQPEPLTVLPTPPPRPADTAPAPAPAPAQTAAPAEPPMADEEAQGQDHGEDGSAAFIHPIFVAPSHARPDRDMGLPETDAETLRKLLSLYVQKQEEICRGAQKLHAGLLRAERLRKQVLHWSKAEAHSGANRDMSDGEDWYDREEWGLTEDLKKGQEEEEEDTTTTGKKTRARR